MENRIQKTPRIELVDALRGFAVMAILLVHNVEHFIFPVYPTDSPEWLNVLDKGTFDAVFALFGGKAYAIFALLFGFTFYIQCENQRRKGKDFGNGREARRLLEHAIEELAVRFADDATSLTLTAEDLKIAADELLGPAPTPTKRTIGFQAN